MITKPTKEQLFDDFHSGLAWSEIAYKYGYKDSKSVRVLAKKYGLPMRRTILKPTKELLEHMILNEKLNPYEIAEKLGYKNGDCIIRRYCKQYGIPLDFRGYYKLREVVLSKSQLSLIHGTLLGDAYLRPNVHTYSLAITHAEPQKDYVYWKYSILSDVVNMDVNQSSNARGFGNSKSKLFYFNTVSHPYFNQLIDKLYINNRKVITTEFLNLLDEMALAVWFMDDGSLNKRYGTMSLSTDCFTYDEHLLMQEWFSEKWNIETKIEPRKRRDGSYAYNIRFNSATGARQLRKLISPYIPQCMSYKVNYK